MGICNKGIALSIDSQTNHISQPTTFNLSGWVIHYDDYSRLKVVQLHSAL